MRYLAFLLAGCMFLMIGVGVAAQEPENLRLIIVDPSGAPQPRTRVSISLPSGPFTAVTSGTGEIVVPMPPDGAFELRVALLGYAASTVHITILHDKSGHTTVNGQDTRNGPVTLLVRPTLIYRNYPVEGVGAAAPPPPPPPTKASSEAPLSNVYWNSWIENRHDGALNRTSVNTLSTETDYSLVLDISALAYINESGLFKSAAVGSALSKLIQQAVHNSQNDLDLNILLLYDQKYFEPLSAGQEFQSIDVSIDKIRALESDVHLTVPTNISLKDSGSAQYVKFQFAKPTIFPLHTNRKHGMTYLGLSVWYRGTPIEEIPLPPICIKNDPSDVCNGNGVEPMSLSGLDSAMLAGIDRAGQTSPAVAIHLIDFAQRGTVVVFKCNSCKVGQPYYTWRIGRRLDDIGRELKESILANVDVSAQISDPTWMARAGKSIFALIFYGDDSDDSSGAIQQLRELIDNSDVKNPPALFVRSVSAGVDPLFLVPLSLAAFETKPGQLEYLGYHFRLETPLVNANYETGSCISRWKVLFPEQTSDASLASARDALKKGLARFGNSVPQCSQGSDASVCFFNDIDNFSGWINNLSSSQPSTALLILSHHDHDRIYWDQSKTIPAALFNTPFQAPSVVIFNACGTAKPGENDILQRLNKNGVSSVIATYSEVPGDMAGRFSTLLLQELHNHANDPAYTLSDAVFNTDLTLRDEGVPLKPGIPAGTKYGAFSLLFGLLGNGGSKICVP
jgi:hypothetical protein